MSAHSDRPWYRLLYLVIYIGGTDILIVHWLSGKRWLCPFLQFLPRDLPPRQFDVSATEIERTSPTAIAVAKLFMLRGENNMKSVCSPILTAAPSRNLSKRKDVEKHLVQMEGRYRGLLEAAPDAMVVVNQGGEIVLLNVQVEKQFGYRRDELVGQPVKNIIPDGFAERLIADDLRSAEDALAQQIGTGIELTGRRKDGSEFPIEIMLSPLESAEGILVTAAIRNISVRKEAEKHLARMEGQIPRAAGGGSRCHGGGEPGGRDRAAECSGREAVWIPPR